MEFYELACRILTFLLLLLKVKEKFEGSITQYKKILLVDLPAR